MQNNIQIEKRKEKKGRQPLPLGARLIAAGYIDAEQCAEGLAYQKEHGGLIGQALIALSHLTEEKLLGFFRSERAAGVARQLLHSGKITQEQLDQALNMQTQQSESIEQTLVRLKTLTQEEIDEFYQELGSRGQGEVPASPFSADAADLSLSYQRLLNSLVYAEILTEQQSSIVQFELGHNGQSLADIFWHFGYMSRTQFEHYLIENYNTKIGEFLLFTGFLNQEQLTHAITYQQAYGGRLGDILVRYEYISQIRLDQIIARIRNKRKTLGELLISNGEIKQEDLLRALDYQRVAGGLLGDILVSLEIISQDTLYRYLANQNMLGRVGTELGFDYSRKLPYYLALQYRCVIVNRVEDRYLLGVEQVLDREVIQHIEKVINGKTEQVFISKDEFETYWENIYDEYEAFDSVARLCEDQPENSAIRTFSNSQMVVMLVLLMGTLVGLAVDYKSTLFVFCIFFQVLYAVMALIKVLIISKGTSYGSQVRFTEEEIAAIDERKLPIVTILVPVYKEKEVVQLLLGNLLGIDYPAHKLDIRIMLEQDDQETIDIVHSMKLPAHFVPIIVPTSQPKTKPKACNYGLIRARGEYVVIFDAEDRPDKDQLKKVYLAFERFPPEYVCMQCKLNYFNSNQNILTKWFTQEYSLWFEMLLPGTMQLHTPVPLGGTSNYFKTSFLKKVGAWDPFNVTEDADLGVRLFKLGYKTAVIDSFTWEEANSDLKNWIRQRSRWIKGYMQTWLVHMRHPIALFKNLGPRGFFMFQGMLLGTPVTPIINPLFWLLMVLWIMTEAQWINDLLPGILYYIAVILLVLGNFYFVYFNAFGIYTVVKEREMPFSFSLVKYALISFIYWIFMSIAAYKALIQLITKPFYWEKTHHGLLDPSQVYTTESSASVETPSIHL